MSDRSFVHLHNHTEYSLLDGATRIKDMVKKAKEMGMPSLAITDHGVMFGCMEFYYACKEEGVKPILGMEAYVAPSGHLNKSGREESSTYHLLLLAKNYEGYQNLCRLHSVAALEGFYYKPRIDHDLLRKHSKGLIGSTTCIGSEVNQHLIRGEYDEAQRLAGMYKEIFDEDSFFVELQDHGIPEQKIMNEQLLKIAKELKLPLVATNDAHYLCQEDSEPHDVLLCIGTGSLRDDPKRLKFNGPNFYLKSPDEMASLFPGHEEAIENSLMFSEMVDLELGSARAMMPDPEIDQGHTPSSYLRHVAEKGLRDRVNNPSDEYFERLNYELGVIEQTGYDEYFLLVKEFAQFTRDQGIMFGVRGSAAGSLVSYTVGITDVDPVDYELTFERFLNPERVSMPDVDMDFEDVRRDEVIRWVTEKYGKERVAQIITFGTLGAKAAIRDAARVMGYQPSEADKIAKTIPTAPGWSIKKAEAEVAEFKQVVKSDPRFHTLVETAKRIEGLSRHAGTHAAGVVISKDPLSETIPLYRSNEGLPVTGYEMKILEKLGLLKMDFLGLSNLTVVAKTIDHIKESYKHLPQDQLIADHPVIAGGHQAIPFEDEKTFEMLSRGETTGVFQLESGGMRRNIVELKPQSVRELAAMVALFRPGPMDHIPTYVSNKFGRTEIEYLDPRMEEVLKETYGVIVYQDQVLKLVQVLAGFTLGRADILRRAMGKKEKATMDKMMGEFIDGCAKNGISESVANKVWELLLPFAGYAFNKAHAVCYAILAYQTAYLKAHYTVEFLAGLLAAFRTKEDRVATIVEECRLNKIPVLLPDINQSDLDFTIESKKKKKNIRFGLGAIKNVGEGVARKIIEEREKEPYTHLFEFCERIRPAGMTKQALESLIKAGALDSLDKNRNKLLEAFEGGLAYADQKLREHQAGQDSLFGESEEVVFAYPELPEMKKPGRNEVLNMEKESLGIYVSDHPLRGYEFSLRSMATHTCAAVREASDVQKVELAGVLAQCTKTISQRGTRVCRVVFEDFTGQVSGFCFGDTVTKFESLLEKDKVVLVSGRIKFDERSQATERTPEVQIFDVKEMPPPLNYQSDPSADGSVILFMRNAKLDQIDRLMKLFEENKGNYEVVLMADGQSKPEPTPLCQRVDPKDEVLLKMRTILTNGEIEVFERAPMD